MRILVVNVNTTESMTEGIAEQARRVAQPGTEIVGLTPAFGAESVEGNLESYLAAVAVMEDRLLLAGLDRRCASVRASGLAVLELESDPERAVQAIVEQAAAAVRDDR